MYIASKGDGKQSDINLESESRVIPSVTMRFLIQEEYLSPSC